VHFRGRSQLFWQKRAFLDFFLHTILLHTNELNIHTLELFSILKNSFFCSPFSAIHPRTRNGFIAILDMSGLIFIYQLYIIPIFGFYQYNHLLFAHPFGLCLKSKITKLALTLLVCITIKKHKQLSLVMVYL